MHDDTSIASLKAQPKYMLESCSAIFSITFGICMYIVEFSVFNLIMTLLQSFGLSATIFVFWKENTNKSVVTIYEDRIESEQIESEQGKVYWKDIKQVKFQREMKHNGKGSYSNRPSLLLYLITGSIRTIQVPSTTYDLANIFCKGLIHIAKFTTVSFYTEHQVEYEKLKLLTKNRENIYLEEPQILIDDKKYI